jgi:hypothetical protein
MPDPRSILERAMERVALQPFTLDGFHARRERKRRNQRIAAGVVGIAVFVAAVWIVTTGWAFDRGSTPGVTGQTPTPEYPGRVGIVGLPPEDAAPSAPSRGELVVGATFGHTGGDPGRFGLHLYADGRLIWQQLGDLPGDDPTPTGLIEQRLTPEGIELVRNAVLATGLFDHDLRLVGAGLPYLGDVEVRDGDRLVRVTWGDLGPREGPETTVTSEQASTLRQLQARLEDLASWLPASAWDDQELRAYVPARYSLCLETGRRVELEQVLSSLPREAEDTLLAWSLTYREDANPNPPGPWYLWCSTVTTERARTLAGVFEDAGVRNNGGDVFGLVFVADPRGSDDVRVSISFEPLLPDAG